MKIGIIGCGLIGQKRAKALKNHIIIGCADAIQEKAESFASLFNCHPYKTWQELLEDKKIEVIIIAAFHSVLPEITLAAVNAGKHVLVEKPAGCHASDLEPIIEVAQRNNVQVHVGFNHRFHRAMQKAKQLVDDGLLGELMFLRARYGHGGRIGYDKEWRANKSLSGGGELIDQGMHLIDLSRWFLGDFIETQGFAHTYYWDMPVDDNGFLLLKTEKQQVAFLHASSSEWKNIFSFEIYGRKGKIAIDGLGGSYGTEKITFYKMLPEMGPPETTIWEYPMADNSWEIELSDFFENIRLQQPVSASLQDAQAALRIVENIYQESNI